MNDLSYSLISAVREGRPERVRELIDTFGLSYSPAWSEGYDLLCDAIENKHTEVTKLLLTNGSKVNIEDKKLSNTPLHFAVMNGDIEIVEILLDKGANIDSKNQLGRTPLHIAALRGYLQIVEHLLKCEAYVDSACREGYTPLWLAVQKGDEDIIKLLLSRGANVYAKGKDGETPLHIAVEKGHDKAVKLLLESGANVEKDYRESERVKNYEDVNNSELLHTAVEKGYLKIVEELLKYGSDVNLLYKSTTGESCMPLHVATKNKQEELAKLLISNGADVNAQDETGKTPIFYATENEDLKIVEVLLQHGADVNISDLYGRTALHCTALGKNIGFLEKGSDVNVKGEIARLLLSRGADANAQTKKGETTLQAATKKEYVKVIEVLLEYDADVNFTDEDGETALHFSALSGNEVISKMLLNKGADVHVKQKYGLTALHIAIEEGGKEVVDLLLKCGVKVNCKDEDDTTPLYIAAQKGYLEIVEILLKLGADIDFRDKKGRTALHIASEEGNEEVVKALLENGSDINIMNKYNCTPLDSAMAGIRKFSYELGHCSYSNEVKYTYCNFGKYACKKIAQILKQHVVKMKAANLYVNKKDLKSIRGKKRMALYQNKCEEEIERMKSEKIGNSNVTFNDILTRSTRLLAICARNKNIVQILKSNDYKTKFPIYASMINSHFRKGVERRELLEQAINILNSLFNSFPKLPYNCNEKIFSHLSDQDLRIIIDA